MICKSVLLPLKASPHSAVRLTWLSLLWRYEMGMILLRHLLGYLPVNLLQGLVGFGSVYVFTRLLSDEDYGRYALALAFMMMVHTVCLTWVEASAYRFAAKAQADNTGPTHFKTLLSLMAISFVPTLLAVGAAVTLFQDNRALWPALAILAVLMPANTLTQSALETWRAETRVARYAGLEIARVGGGFLAGVSLAYWGGLGAASPLAGMALAALVTGSIGLGMLWGRARTGRQDNAAARSYAAYGLPIAAALALDLALSSGDRFLIAYFIDAAAVGAYAAGYGLADKTVAMVFMWAGMAGSALIMARYEQDGPEAAREAATGLVRTQILLATPAALGLALVATPLAVVMIGPDLREAARHMIGWIAFGAWFNGFVIYYFSEAFQLTRRTGERALLMVIPAVLNIGLNILLLPKIGVMGAVYSTVACYALAAVLLASFGRRRFALPLPWSDLVRVALACSAMAGIVLLLDATPLSDWGALAELLTKAGAGALTYGAMVFMLDAAGARGFVKSLLRRETGETP
jgi:O-antigen/teichoic acid export membrane protein